MSTRWGSTVITAVMVGHRGESKDSSSDYTDDTHTTEENRLGDETDLVEAEIQLYGL